MEAKINQKNERGSYDYYFKFLIVVHYYPI